MRAILTLYSTLLLAQDLGVLSQQGKQAMGAGRYQEAAALYRRMLIALPSDAGLRLNLGLALFSLGNYPGAETELKKAVAGHPDLQPAWLLLGLTYQKQHLPAQAVDPLQKALKLNPADDTARLELADAYLNTGKPRLASEEFRSLSDRQPRNPKVWQGLALSYVELARTAKDPEQHSALDQCESALAHLRELPDSPALHELTAQSYELQGRRSEAVAEWRMALALAPGETRLEGSLARALWRNREYDEAQPLLENLVKREPLVAEWNYLLGDLFYRLEQNEKSLPYLENALKREPNQLAAHSVLGRVYIQLGQPEKAIPHLLQALQTDVDGSLHYQLGLAYRRTGHPDQAQTMFRLQRELQNKNP